MINTSNEYKQVILSDDRKFYGSATVTLSNGAVLNLDNSNIIGLKIEDATSLNNQFTLGAAIINKLTLSINNVYDDFSQYDFTDAIIRPAVGLQLSKTIETLRKGVFISDDPKAIGSVINLTALDNMVKFDIPFKDVSISFPTTAKLLLNAICLYCGVPLATTIFMNEDFIIQQRPFDDAINCREVISWIAQISRNFARCNMHGELELKWYNFEVFENEASIDGGGFDKDTPHSTGNNVNGGNFTDYTSGDDLDGGSFIIQKRYHHIYRFFGKPIIATDDVVITGVSVTDSSEDPHVEFFGQEGYVISITGNKLIQSQSDAIRIAKTVGEKIVGMRFRPMTATALSDPSREAGDVTKVSIRKGNSYQALLTNVSFSIGKHDRLSCDAEPPSRNNSTRYSEGAKAITEARKIVKKEISAYDQAVKQFNDLVFNSMGLYHSKEELLDGSTIEYSHDKPALAESQNIWRKSADAFAVSNDGGQNWRGMDASGNILANVLTTIGVNADWIRTGKITSLDGNTLIDLSLGVVNSDNIQMVDNVANGYPLRMPFNIDASTSVISEVVLKWTIDKFRTYATGASSGGGANETSTQNGGYFGLSSYEQVYTTLVQDYGYTTNTGNKAAFSGESHNHSFTVNPHTHTAQSGSHAHTVNIMGHSHTTNLPNHTHDLLFGILETNVSENSIKIFVDGIERAEVLGAQGEITVTQWITVPGWHTIELRSISLKRISAQVNIKSYIRR